MFSVGDYVVYGLNGVCEVVAVGPVDMAGITSDKDYYTLAPLYKKGNRVFTPVDNQKVVIRPVITKKEALALIEEMKDIPTIETKVDKLREQTYKEALKSCDCRELISVINTVNQRSEERLAQGKKMSVCDERYHKSAIESLYGEFAVSLGIPKDEVEDFVEHRHALAEMASAS